ncbi:MAG TPA: glycoside hydrolase, partial [Terriglobales bacterium]
EPTLPPTAAPSSLSAGLDLETGWTVTFPDLHRSAQLDHLHSWADDAATRFYSGRAIYENKFTFSTQTGKKTYLDFGAGTPNPQTDKHSRFFAGLDSPIGEAAQVYLNDQFAGSVWRPPYRVDVTHLLRKGENDLRVVVYNSALNEMAGRALPDYRLLNSRYGVRFVPQDIEDIKPLPSGLLGKVQLLWEAP